MLQPGKQNNYISSTELATPWKIFCSEVVLKLSQMNPHTTQEETDFLSMSASQDCTDHFCFDWDGAWGHAFMCTEQKKFYFKLYCTFIIFTVPSSYPALPRNGLSCNEHLFSALFWRLELNLHRFFRGKLSSSFLFLVLFNLWYFIGTLQKNEEKTFIFFIKYI